MTVRAIVFTILTVFCLQPEKAGAILIHGMFSIDKQFNTKFKRTHVVFGIVAVVFLELGFTTFISTSDLAERSSMIVNNADGRIAPVPIRENVGLASIRPEDFVIIPDVEDIIPSGPVHGRKRKESHQVKAAVRPEHLAATKKRYRPAKVKPYEAAATYSIKRPSVKDDRKDNTAPRVGFEGYDATFAEASIKPKSEKRSLIASALPIVKKPYSWVKALGSKLF
jgi:hypothetical protein